MPIELKQVTREFGDVRALDEVTLTLGGDRIYGLLGNNGAGKSTLLGILTNRLYPTYGSVTVDGEPVAENDAALGKVFLAGEQNLYPEEMRVGRAFDLAERFYPEFDRAYAEELARKFGLDTKKKISALSTGYGSIFRLILGLSVNVPYLLFDEPVLGLDAQHRDLFYRLLMEKYAQRPCTVVISTHLIAEAANLIEHAVIIRDGRILRDQPAEELLADAYAVSGPARLVEDYLTGKRVLSRTALGGLETASVQGQPDRLPAGLEVSRLNLQDYFIGLMEEEDRK